MLNALYRKMFVHPAEIKKKNELFLTEKGARICDWLPYIESDSVMRSSFAAGQRAAILCAMYNISLDTPTLVIREWLEKNGLLDHLSFKEKEMLGKNEQDLTPQEMCNLSWYIESLHAFLWAGSVFETLPITQYFPETIFDFIPDIQKDEPAQAFIKSFKLRPYKQIYEMLDLHYRAHWFVRDASLCHEDTKEFDYSIIVSRRTSLEWIFDNQSDWDDVDLST